MFNVEFTGITLVRLANREDPDQTTSELGLYCLSRVCTVCILPFWQASSVQNFRTYTTCSIVLITIIMLFFDSQSPVEMAEQVDTVFSVLPGLLFS